ncbi:MAG: hypothetical protein WDW38_006645 [Sanguina aurantia]
MYLLAPEEIELDHLLLTDVAQHMSRGSGYLWILDLDAPRVACVLIDMSRRAKARGANSGTDTDTVSGCFLLMGLSE